MNKCTTEGCDKTQRTRNLCSIHYRRFLRYGDANILLREYRGISKHSTMLEEFLANFEPVTESGCWIWTGPTNKGGYGQSSWKGIYYRAHRFSYKQFKGPIPENMFVCHACDVRCCVNPEHLFLGTHLENIQDMLKKKRQARGEKNNKSKLNTDQVLNIRASPEFITTLAKQYNVSTTSIWDIKIGKTWRHV